MGTAITYDLSNENFYPRTLLFIHSFDSPSSTSQITYKVGVQMNSNRTWYLNRTVADTDSFNYERGISLICVTEIAG